MRGGNRHDLAAPAPHHVAVTRLSYVLPIRVESLSAAVEIAPYLEWISARTELIIVDGSAEEQFSANERIWAGIGLHVVPARARKCLNGKAWGVLTGLDHAHGDRVILADDDVRYDETSLFRMQELLRESELVRPQNYFDPLPWHAAWDTARTLINRATGADFPGTLGIRPAILTSSGGYDGDVLFENLELMRTVQALGGRMVDAPDFYIRRLPPTPGRFWSQRTRQAYDDLAMPLRLTCFITVLPAVGMLVRRRAWGGMGATAAMLVGLAEWGRYRHGGRRVFPARASLLAPVWVLERGTFCWAAVWQRFIRGGCHYHGNILKRAATPQSRLRRHARHVPVSGPCAGFAP